MRIAAILAGVATLAVPGAAHAFCGFYVSGADAELYNNATMVVMMRDGTRTVLSMQNNYEGPPEDFAMVVPVPVVLQKKQVKTLEKDVFDRVDSLAAPRLVEYWEQDPCYQPPPYDDLDEAPMMAESITLSSGGGRRSKRYQVKIESKFTVGEYDILILSAKDATGLDAWLRDHDYTIPDGADALLEPYIAQGMKFFVAKVDVEKVAFEDGQAMLSPLRFYYDSGQFNLPVRLGLVNSSGTQDLLVHVLGRGKRYEVANYDNVTIPTNLNVSDDTREAFGAFYAQLFDTTLEKYPKSVVTEYSWDASSCDPCPTPALTSDELYTLGADVIRDKPTSGWTLTRLHARYGEDILGDDLVFREAEGIVGGREFVTGEDGAIERGAQKSTYNNFQARYIIRHAWEGPIECENPRRGVWGGPPGGGHNPNPNVSPAKEIAFADRSEDVTLDTFLEQDVEEIDFRMSDGSSSVTFRPAGIERSTGCAGCAATGGGAAGGVLVLLAFAFVIRRRRNP